IKNLHARLGITVLYVTHDQEEAMAMSDRICLMNHGRIEQIGTPQELYFGPRNVFVARFLGDSNIVDATVEETGRIMRLAGPDGVRISAVADGEVSRGEAVKLVLRPERVRLMNAGESADNLVVGVVREMVFVGGVTRYFVTLPGGAVLSAKHLSHHAHSGLRPGNAVRLGWSAADGLVLRQSGPE